MTVVFAAAAEHDLALIEAHLLEAYQSFGGREQETANRAEGRIERILTSAERLGKAPFRGEAHDALPPGLQH